MPIMRSTPLNDEVVEEMPVDPTPEEPVVPSIPATPLVPATPDYKPPTTSIMLTVKKMLGIAEEYHAFDLDIITNINAVFFTLNQLGIGPEFPFSITGPETEWSDFLGDHDKLLQGIQTYTYMRVRLMFDPPTNSFLVDSMQKQIDQMEWRFMTQVDYFEHPIDDSGNASSDLKMVEMTPERVKEIYDGVINSGGTVDEAISSILKLTEMTPERVKTIYDGISAESAISTQSETATPKIQRRRKGRGRHPNASPKELFR